MESFSKFKLLTTTLTPLNAPQHPSTGCANALEMLRKFARGFGVGFEYDYVEDVNASVNTDTNGNIVDLHPQSTHHHPTTQPPRHTKFVYFTCGKWHEFRALVFYQAHISSFSRTSFHYNKYDRCKE